MSKTRLLPLAALLPGLLLSQSALAKPAGWGIRGPSFRQVIKKVTRMPWDRSLQSRAKRYGLRFVNVMWEDTGRYQGSSVGPNISDLTLQVRERRNGRLRTHLLPVVRHPNYSDKTADIAAEKLFVRVGNQRNGELVTVPLTEVLSNLKEYMSKPQSLKGKDDFLAPRDSHFLTSAQHVFLPITKSGKVEFNPVLYNYQSMPGSPAVLTLLVTREGTSITVIENKSGDQSYQGWGQQLYFNNKGQRTVFTAERKSAVKARINNGQAQSGDAGALEEGADMMMIVQVPLKHRTRRRFGYGIGEAGGALAPMASGAPVQRRATRGRSDMEQAVLGHGKDLGPFKEAGGLKLQRDERFPIRVTVQFYKATSNGVISAKDMEEVYQGINRVYQDADYVGSLVTGSGAKNRPTEWQRNPHLHHVREHW